MSLKSIHQSIDLFGFFGITISKVLNKITDLIFLRFHLYEIYPKESRQIKWSLSNPVRYLVHLFNSINYLINFMEPWKLSLEIWKNSPRYSYLLFQIWDNASHDFFFNILIKHSHHLYILWLGLQCLFVFVCLFFVCFFASLLLLFYLWFDPILFCCFLSQQFGWIKSSTVITNCPK